jgi:hypothetical protein
METTERPYPLADLELAAVERTEGLTKRGSWERRPA